MKTEKTKDIPDLDLLRGHRVIIIEGVLTTIFMAVTGAMVGSIFLTNFFLKLGATSLEIGILAALPQLAYIGQFLGSYYIEKYGRRKKFCITTATLHKLLWFVAMAIPLLLPQLSPQVRVWIILSIIFVSSLFGALTSAAWTSWMADFVHAKIRGKFFGQRNIYISLVTFLLPAAIGKYLDLHGDFLDYAFVFGLATLIGLGGTWFLKYVPPVKVEKEPNMDFIDIFRVSLQERNFRRFLYFIIFWVLGTTIMTPYVPVFLLRQISLTQYTIGIYIALFTLTHITATLIWGNLSEQFGHRPVLVICVLAVSFLPLGFAITTPHNYWLVMPMLYLASGIFWAGIGLSLFNLLMALLPNRGKSIFVSSFFSFVGLFGVIAPLLGALVMEKFRGFSYNISGLLITHYTLLFVIATLLRFIAFAMLIKIKVKVKGEISAPALIRRFRLINPFMAFTNLTLGVRAFWPSARKQMRDKK